MTDHVGAERSVEALQAYLIVYLQSLPDLDRGAFVKRLSLDEGYMAAVLSVLHSTHDAMVACLSEPDDETPSRVARVVDSPDLFDSDLANVACFTLGRFSPAIVMDLDPASAARALLRLGELLAAAQARVSKIKLH